MKVERSYLVTKEISTTQIFDFISVAEHTDCQINIVYHQQEDQRTYIDFTTMLLSLHENDQIILSVDGNNAVDTFDQLATTLLPSVSEQLLSPSMPITISESATNYDTFLRNEAIID